MTSVVLVASRTPSAVGPGGRHRAYQLHHELASAFGEANCHLLDLAAWRENRPAERPRARPAHPLAWAYPTGFSTAGFAPRAFVADYESLIARLPRPVVTVVDDARLRPVLDAARRSGSPTVACLHNLESLDLATMGTGGWARPGSHLLDLATELDALRECDARLFISKVEAGLVGGFGLDADVHPYLPVGEIRDGLLGIRRARESGGRDPGLVVAIGSAMHATTRRALERLLEEVRAHGLPAGTRLVVAGACTEDLAGPRPAGVETPGWVEQPALDRLLAAARCAVVPQFSGFGAVTRIVELACAGVPVVTGVHPTFAIDLPPGVRVAGHGGGGLLDAVAGIGEAAATTLAAFETWESSQPRTLADTVALCAGEGGRPAGRESRR